MNSLRLRLLLWVLAPITAVFALVMWQSRGDARNAAAAAQDRLLLASARTLAGQIFWGGAGPLARTPPAALEMFVSGERDQVYFRTRTDAGVVLSGWPDLPAAALAGDGPAYGDAVFRGQSVRLVTLMRTLYNDNRPLRVAVTVAETRHESERYARALWRPTLLREAGLLVLVLAFMLLGLTLELRPLMRLRDAVLERDSDDLAPIGSESLQLELRPVVETMNQYAVRLNRQIEAQKRFIADAAHQLRTPLALLDTQLHHAGQLPASPPLRETLDALGNSTRHLIQVVNQLLSLSRAESGDAIRDGEAVDLQALAHEVLIELAGLAEARGIDLGLAPDDPDGRVLGSRPLLQALLFNLVDNAVRYTPPGGSVTVSVRRDGARWLLCVEDTGPGIPAELRPRVFDRFNRGNATDAAGTGLGLAIVKEAASACRASVRLEPGARGVGLRVTVSFAPAAPGPRPLPGAPRNYLTRKRI